MAEDRAPRNPVRFAFWGAEESGLVGSTRYVAELTEEEGAKIGLNLNFDMLGSPNFIRLVYDGDGYAFGTAGPAGSDEIEHTFAEYFAAKGLALDPTAFDGRSDYKPFIDVGIPAGGLFSGAEERQDGRRAGALRRRGGRGVRPLLPPGVRHPVQRQLGGPAPAVAAAPCTRRRCSPIARSRSAATETDGSAAQRHRAARTMTRLGHQTSADVTAGAAVRGRLPPVAPPAGPIRRSPPAGGPCARSGRCAAPRVPPTAPRVWRESIRTRYARPRRRPRSTAQTTCGPYAPETRA